MPFMLGSTSNRNKKELYLGVIESKIIKALLAHMGSLRSKFPTCIWKALSNKWGQEMNKFI